MPTRSHAFLAALFLASLVAHAAPADAFETYKVVGAAAGDKLTIREEPQEGGKPTDWASLGSLSADATHVLDTGRSKEVGKQRWSEITVGAITGWVNARFLATADDPVDLKEATFLCAGTEPFWGVTLSPKEGEFSDPDSKWKLTTERVQPAMARFFPLLYRLRNDKGQSLRATVTHQTWCTDGMSEYDYAFQVTWSTMCDAGRDSQQLDRRANLVVRYVSTRNNADALMSAPDRPNASWRIDSIHD